MTPADPPKSEPQISSPPPIPATESSETHHANAEPQKKRKWLPIVIVAGALVVVLPIVAIIAFIAIPTIISIKKEAANLTKSIQESPIPVAIPKPEKPVVKEITPVVTPKIEPAPPKVVVAPTPAKKTPPKVENKPIDPATLKLAANAPVWSKSAGRKDLRRFLVDLWELEKLADDPFYDLGETILTQNLDKPGPLDQRSELALFVLPRKLREYPHLVCGALTILSPNDRGAILKELETLAPRLNNPILTLQILALKADHSKNPFHIRDALKALEVALDSELANQLPDSVIFHLLSERFLYRAPAIAPDNYLKIVEASNAIPTWLKDYKTGEVHWQKLSREFLNNRDPDFGEMEKSYATITEKLTASWQANPRHPAAATKMMEVIGGHDDTKIEDVRVWFDRAIEAQADYGPAYSTYMKALAIEGTNENPMGLNFATACAATKRFDTVIPMVLVDAHIYQSARLDKVGSEYWSSLFGEELQELETLFTGLDKAQSLLYDGVTEKSIAAMTWYLIGNKEKAAQQIKNLDGRFDQNALRAFQMRPIEKAQFEDFLKQES